MTPPMRWEECASHDTGELAERARAGELSPGEDSLLDARIRHAGLNLIGRTTNGSSADRTLGDNPSVYDGLPAGVHVAHGASAWTDPPLRRIHDEHDIHDG